MMRKWSFRPIRENRWQETIRRQDRLFSMYAAGLLGEEVPLLEFEQTTGFLAKISGLFHRGR